MYDVPFDELLTPLRTVDVCVCGDPIYEGMEYFTIDNKAYCKECIENSKTFAD